MPEGYLTREDYIAKYGVDPEVQFQQKQDAQTQEAAGSVYDTVKNHLKAIGTDIATIPTDFIAFPGIVSSAAQALYGSYANDTSFGEEWDKQTKVDNAAQNMKDYENQVAAGWKQANPAMTDDELNAGIEQFRKSKQYEDFAMEQLKGTSYLQAKAKDVARKALGDYRTEEQRPWTEGVAGAIGTAMIGGPAGWASKVASGAAKTGGLTNLAVNNPISRGALKTAEVFTPLTMPYTPTNVAINAAAGIAMDQGGRALLGHPSLFTPDKDDSTVTAVAGSGLGVLGAAAIVAATKGRAVDQLKIAHESGLAKAIKESPGYQERIAQPIKPGEASIVAGPEQQLGPTPDDLPLRTEATRTGRGQVFDEAEPLYGAIRDIHGREAAAEAEAVFSINTGFTLRDGAERDTHLALRGVNNSIQAMPRVEADNFIHGLQAQGHMERRAITDAMYTARIGQLDHQITQLEGRVDSVSNMRRGKLQAEADAQRERLNALRNDEPDARLALPDIPTSEIERVAKAWREDNRPHMLRAKQEVRAWADAELDRQVVAGKMTQEMRNYLRGRTEYYTPLINDPLKGTTGLQRFWRSVTTSVRKQVTQESRGTAGTLRSESPIKEMNWEIPPKRDPADMSNRWMETRVTAPLDAVSAMHMYTLNNFHDTAKTKMRNYMIKQLTQKSDGSPSDLVKNGRIQLLRKEDGTSWVDGNNLGNPHYSGNIDKGDVVPHWEGGRVQLWKLGDAQIAAALRQDPFILSGLMAKINQSSSWFKFFTTGRGNPAFALTGAGYDLVIGMLTRLNNRAFGPLSHWTYRMSPTLGKAVFSVLPDPTALPGALYHVVAGFAETLAHYTAHYVANKMAAETPAFAAMRAVVGQKAYTNMVATAMKIATKTDNFATTQLNRVAGHGVTSIDNIATVRGAYAMTVEHIPRPVRGAWQFYSDLLNSIYLGPKRMFYTENYALLHKAHGGNIPEGAMARLINETRTIGGDMAKVPASKSMRDLEMMFPYLTQAKLGAYHLARNMSSKDTMAYMIPRLMLATYGVSMGYYWRHYWNDESRKQLWNMPESQRWRSLFIPSPTLLMAWARGENPAYDRKLFYVVNLPPDIAGIVAGSTAFMQMMGMIPANVTPRPISKDIPNAIVDSVMPAMPPLLQAALGTFGYKLDPQGSDTRGGNWIRDFNSRFRSGPQAEVASNLGQVTNSQSLIMSALFGAMGSHVATGTDIMLHASKYHSKLGPENTLTPRQTRDFGEGLRAATTEVFNLATQRIPDVPLLWHNKDKYYTSTPSWQYMGDTMTHLQSIKGTMDHATGKQAQIDRMIAANVGGVPKEVVTDAALLEVGQIIKQWQNPTGELGILRKQYQNLQKANQSLARAYNLSQDERKRRTDDLIKQMQSNVQQQMLATKYLEQQLSQQYGPYLASRLHGRGISIASIDQMLRESLGTVPAAASAQAQSPE